MDRNKYLRFVCGSDYHQSYLELADFPHDNPSGAVKETVRVHNFIPNYDGPGIAIDFDKHGRAIGIEILYAYSDDETVDTKVDN